MLESAARLKLCLLCNSRTPTAKMLMYSPLLPLIVIVDVYSFKTTQSKENIHFSLQHSDRVSSIFVKSWSSELSMALDRAFPKLETLSVSSLYPQPPALPEKFVAPRLRFLHLCYRAISVVPSFLANAAANLISLTLDGIQPPSYLPPESLIEYISSMPQLGNLSISFDTPFHVHSTETGLWRTQITPIVLPCLWKFTFIGLSDYLEKMLALISTPLLQCFRIIFFPQDTLAVPSLLGFFRTIKNLEFRTAVVSMESYLGTVTITYHPRQPLDFLSSFTFSIDDDVNQLNRQVAAVLQLCTAAAPTLYGVEGLSLELYDDYIPDDFAVRSKLWYTFFRLFKALRTLQVDFALTPEMASFLNPGDGTTAEELLPMLSELVVVSKFHLVINNPFATFIHSRRLTDYPINFRTIKQLPSVLESSDAS